MSPMPVIPRAAAMPTPPTGSAPPPTSRPTVPIVAPAADPLAAMHPHDAHDTTPTGRPSWYGDRIGREERSWLSRTGDVELLAGNTFGRSFHSFCDATARAREASADGQGAVAIFSPSGHDVHAGRFYLARVYNAEHLRGQGLIIGRSHFDGDEKGFSNWHPELHAVVDGPRLIHGAQVTPR